MISVTIEDYDKMISSLSVSIETPEIIVIHGDMGTHGKRADILAGDYGEFFVMSDPERGEYKGNIKINDLPANMIVLRSEVSRYTLCIILIASDTILKGRELYR